MFMKPAKDNKYFHFYNANPKNKKIGDCVYRTLSFFLGISYEEIIRKEFDFYYETGLKFSSVYHGKDTLQFSSIRGHHEYLKKLPDINYVPVDETVDNIIGKPHPKIKDFIDRIADKRKTYYIECPDHCTIVKNNMVWDTFDCSDFPVSGYYFFEESSKKK